jgi:plastocyanin
MALNFPSEPELNDIHSVGDTTWKWDGTAWNVVPGASVPGQDVYTFKNINVDGSVTLEADSLTDTLNIVAGSNISLTGDAGTDTITITSTASGGGGGGETQNLFETVTAGGTSITAASPTDSFSLTAGSNISISADAESNVITIGNTLTPGATAFTGLSDSGTLTVDTLAYGAIATYIVSNSGNSAYTFSHFSGSNPTLYAISGTTIAFKLTASNHPFEIQSPSGNPYNTGLVHVGTDGVISTGADAQGKDSGTLYWQIPFDISGTYRYQCQNHTAMVGGITIKSFIAV